MNNHDLELDNLYPQYKQAIKSLMNRIKQLEEVVSEEMEFPYEAQLLALDVITATQQLQIIIKQGEQLKRSTPEEIAKMNEPRSTHAYRQRQQRLKEEQEKNAS